MESINYIYTILKPILLGSGALLGKDLSIKPELITSMMNKFILIVNTKIVICYYATWSYGNKT